MPDLRTDRLLLRAWRDSDLGPWAALNADPEVREHFPQTLTREQSEASAATAQADIERHGWGWWAVEVVATGTFIGFTGLHSLGPSMPCSGVEAGWRLARAAWGHGYATEAARAALDFGFGTLGLPEIVSITAVPNLRSQAVMRRLGMVHHPARDFDHPAIPEGPLRRHVLYGVTAEAHRAGTGG
ncbi:GNAT family N-acetyltransferase [Streptomyces clavuligerus]|nr:GNAT family N-acetyltransferase [Streptomyces clavuligerus]